MSDQSPVTSTSEEEIDGMAGDPMIEIQSLKIIPMLSDFLFGLHTASPLVNGGILATALV